MKKISKKKFRKVLKDFSLTRSDLESYNILDIYLEKGGIFIWLWRSMHTL